MFPTALSNSPSMSEEGSVSSGTRALDYTSFNSLFSSISTDQQTPKAKKRRSQPGNPDPDAEVVALSPKTLLATNRFICEICNKGFQRDQNLQLHRRGHNLPWKLRLKNHKEIAKKRVYVCPEASCVHHSPSRALGDLTGIKKHFCRKHGEKKWKCDKCFKKYAVMSDWKAHSKTCGTREYRCDCGTLFSRKDSFITHRAFCEALAEESARLAATATATASTAPLHLTTNNPFLPFSSRDDPLQNPNPSPNPSPTIPTMLHVKHVGLQNHHFPTTAAAGSSACMSAAALLKKTSCMGPYTDGRDTSTWGKQNGGGCLTRDFLGVAGEAVAEELLSFAGSDGEFVAESCERDGATVAAAAGELRRRHHHHPVFGFHTAATSHEWGDC